MNYKERYKELIIKMVQESDDEKFLKKVYTIIICHIRRAGH